MGVLHCRLMQRSAPMMGPGDLSWFSLAVRAPRQSGSGGSAFFACITAKKRSNSGTGKLELERVSRWYVGYLRVENSVIMITMFSNRLYCLVWRCGCVVVLSPRGETVDCHSNRPLHDYRQTGGIVTCKIVISVSS